MEALRWRNDCQIVMKLAVDYDAMRLESDENLYFWFRTIFSSIDGLEHPQSRIP